MTIDIDVRTMNPDSAEVTGIFFADGKRLIGSPRERSVSVDSGRGRVVEVCDVNDLESLGKALQVARRIWGVVDER